MNNYWEERYKLNGNSGIGSYGIIADMKANVINECINKYNIKTISDFGCGDGNQISLIKSYENYYGYDISPYIINMCKIKFNEFNNMEFYDNIDKLPKSDLTMSLDVIYHIIDYNEFENYMYKLFDTSNKYVAIFSSNFDEKCKSVAHIVHRNITKWIDENIMNFKLIDEINDFDISSAKFFIYVKI